MYNRPGVEGRGGEERGDNQVGGGGEGVERSVIACRQMGGLKGPDLRERERERERERTGQLCKQTCDEGLRQVARVWGTELLSTTTDGIQKAQNEGERGHARCANMLHVRQVARGLLWRLSKSRLGL